MDADAFSSPASAGPVLGAVRPLSQNSAASLKGGGCHPHFTEEETKAEVGTQGKALSPPSILKQGSFHCTEKSVGP